MSIAAQILSAVVQIAANYGGTLTQPINSFNNPVTTGDAIVVFVSCLSTDGYVVSVTDSQSNLYLAVDPNPGWGHFESNLGVLRGQGRPLQRYGDPEWLPEWRGHQTG